MKKLKDKGQHLEGFFDDDIIFELEDSLDNAIEEIMEVDLKKRKVFFRLVGGLICDSSDSFSDGDKTYLAVDVEGETVSLRVKADELEEVVENALNHESEEQESIKEHNRDIYAYHGMSVNDFL